MVSPIQERSVLDINAAVEEHSSIVPDLLVAHGLTGCHTVASYFGIHKVAAVKVLRHDQRSLNLLGNTGGPPFSEVVDRPHTSCWPGPLVTPSAAGLHRLVQGKKPTLSTPCTSVVSTLQTEHLKENV